MRTGGAGYLDNDLIDLKGALMNRPVVVGVDGSSSSLVAAEHAARSAVQRSRPLHLVHGYLHPLGYGVPLNPYDLGVPAPTVSVPTAGTGGCVGSLLNANEKVPVPLNVSD